MRKLAIASSFIPPYEPIISSIQNPWVKRIRRLHVASGRKEHQKFLCEGTHLLQEAIATSWTIECVCFTQEWVARNASIQNSLHPSIRQQLVSSQVLNQLATTERPDGVVFLVKTQVNASQPQKISLGLVLETLQEPGNLGTLIRTAVATNADGIWISPDSVDPLNSKVLRSTAGQWFRKPPIVTPLRPMLEIWRTQSIQILAAAKGGKNLWDCDLTKPTLFLLGNEGAGLSKSIRDFADETISVPMANGVESLNVGTTGSLLLYEAIRQRRYRTTKSNGN